MKKLLLSCVLALGAVTIFNNSVYADAQSCVIRENDTCDTDDEYLIIPGYRGCYVCESNKCVSGDVVAATNARLQNNTYQFTVFTCQLGGTWGNDRWEHEPMTECTRNIYVELKNDPNAQAIPINPNTGQPVFNDNSAQAVFGVIPCIGYVCYEGYTKINGKCVSDNMVEAESICTSSGGSWNGSSCTCASAKNLKLKLDGKSCECISADYEPDGVNGCKKKQSVINEENNRRQRQQNQQRQTACQNSGGTWKNNQCVCDGNKNLRTENNVCVCLDDTNYRRQGNECILTDAAALQRDCDSDASRASGAYWDANTKQCLCTNPQHIWRNKVCVMNPAIENCQNIPGAAWNASTKTCYCTDSDKELNAEGTACVETDEAKKRREDESTQSAISASTRRIAEAKNKLDSLAEGFSKSVWKTAEGKFNTSRLASDSIAAVVLGTAGGLITSNVIKKNQVENGFEDIQCTVGGQVVAGWGDEFRVGIQ